MHVFSYICLLTRMFIYMSGRPASAAPRVAQTNNDNDNNNIKHTTTNNNNNNNNNNDIVIHNNNHDNAPRVARTSRVPSARPREAARRTRRRVIYIYIYV